MAQAATAKELREALGDIHQSITVGGKTLDITPMSLFQVADALDSVERLAGTIGGGGLKSITAKLVLRGGHDFIELLRIATGEELDWVRALNPVDALRLAKVVYQVNYDFFVQNTAEVKELLGPLWDLAANWIEQLGQEPSKDSSATDTPLKP